MSLNGLGYGIEFLVSELRFGLDGGLVLALVLLLGFRSTQAL